MATQTVQAEGRLIDPKFDFGSVTDRIVGIPLQQRFNRAWLMLFGAGCAASMMLLVAVAWVLYRGVGVWGINIPVAWGFAIINFVWWIGIGHAGTLISAILLLMRQEWRTSINRLAEAMTLFAVAMAGLFPLLHLGRFWKWYYLLPYPDTMNLYPQWRSPLVWDVVAVMTYGTVSLLFWYLGLVPDMATMRDTAQRRWVRRAAGILSLGWRGSARHWQRYQTTYLLLAGLATPLVVSVHSIVALDFAVAVLPGWQVTLFPPYFVAGAIFSGMSMVLTIVLPLRAAFRLHDLITVRHLDAMAKVMLTSGLIVAYGYIFENFTAALSADEFELSLVTNRAAGPYAPWYWATLTCNVLVAQLLWIRPVRRHAGLLFIVALFINVGMWLERYVIVIVSLHRDFLPSAWGMYEATLWDWLLFLGTLGLFFTLVLLFIRLIPMISIHEVRELLKTRGCSEGRDTPVPPQTDTGAKFAQGHLAGDDLYGIAAEYDRSEALLGAVRSLRARGYSRMDAYAPYPVEGLPEALGLRRTRMPVVFLAAGLTGSVAIYAYQYYTSVLHYQWNIGGKPPHSWLSFVPLTFEVGVLSASVIGFLIMMARNALPQPFHPIRNVPGFRRVTRDRYFVSVESHDAHFDPVRTRELLESAGPLRVVLVPRSPEGGS